jgi:transcriptional regulator GlxA family with amidase domain
MREHLNETLNLTRIARGAGVSASHLEHVFKKTGQRPVMSCLMQLRIQRAKQLLLESNLNVSQIAEMMGFSSVHVFSRCFKKAVSFSPSQYAKTVQLAAAGGAPQTVHTPVVPPASGLMPLR